MQTNIKMKDTEILEMHITQLKVQQKILNEDIALLKQEVKSLKNQMVMSGNY